MIILTLVQLSFVLHIMSSLNSKVVDPTLMFWNIKLYSQWLWVEQTTNLESASPVIDNILSDWFCLQLTRCQVNLAFAACALRGLKKAERNFEIAARTLCLRVCGATPRYAALYSSGKNPASQATFQF